MKNSLCLSIIEMGGYPNFAPLYQRFDFQTETLFNMRKAQSWLKKNQPILVVAEFHFDPDMRDRMSTLESLLASLQRYAPNARVITFIEKEFHPRFMAVQTRYPHLIAAVEYPINEDKLKLVLEHHLEEIKNAG